MKNHIINEPGFLRIIDKNIYFKIKSYKLLSKKL